MTRMPQVTARELLEVIGRAGFKVDRQAGSHVTLVHDDRRSVTVPLHAASDLGRGLAVRILKDAGFTVDDYIRLQ